MTNNILTFPPRPATYTFSRADDRGSTVWKPARGSWSAFVKFITEVKVGKKEEGGCLSTAVFEGNVRAKRNAKEVGLLALDCDYGYPLETMLAALDATGWTYLLHSTSSHNKTTTDLRMSQFGPWEDFSARRARTHARANTEHKPFPTDRAARAALFLRERDTCYPELLEGGLSVVGTITKTERRSVKTEGRWVWHNAKNNFLQVKHRPIPRWRVYLPLEKPWRVADFPDAKTALKAYSDMYLRVIDRIGLRFDESCRTPDRIMYLWRVPSEAALAECVTRQGGDRPVRLDDLAAEAAVRKRAPRPATLWVDQRGTSFGVEGEEDGKTVCWQQEPGGDLVDLTSWMRDYSRDFLLADALMERGQVVLDERGERDGHLHLVCPFEAEHSPTAGGFFVRNANERGGFAATCIHHGCSSRPRTDFIGEWLSTGALELEDLRNPQFHRNLKGQFDEELPDEPAAPPARSKKVSVLPAHRAAAPATHPAIAPAVRATKAPVRPGTPAAPVPATLVPAVRRVGATVVRAEPMDELEAMLTAPDEMDALEALLLSADPVDALEAMLTAPDEMDDLERMLTVEDGMDDLERLLTAANPAPEVPAAETEPGDDGDAAESDDGEDEVEGGEDGAGAKPAESDRRSELMAKAALCKDAAGARAVMGEALKQRWKSLEASELLAALKKATGIGATALKKEFAKLEKRHRETGEPEDWVKKLNEDFFVVNEHGKTVVYSYNDDPALNRRYLQRSEFHDFAKLYCNEYVSVVRRGETEEVAMGQAWLNHPQRRSYRRGVSFIPEGAVPPGVFNMWTGFPVKPRPGDWSLMKAHIFHNLCRSNAAHFRYLMCWLARAVQYPAEQGKVAIVLRGKRGTGKGIFVKFVGAMFGHHYLHLANGESLVGRFNEHLADTVLVFADEAVFAGDKKHESQLKVLVTEDFLHIEGKHKTARQMRNYTHIIMASNEQWAVPAGAEERRFFVLEVSEDKIQDYSYFSAIEQQMKAGGLEAMFAELRSMDISDWSAWKVPSTEGLMAQKLQTLNSTAEWWLNVLEEGTVRMPGRGGLESEALGAEWARRTVSAPKEQLFTSYLDYCAGLRVARPSGRVSFWATMEQLCPDMTYSQRSTGDRARRAHFPTLDICREKFQKFIGGKIRALTLPDNAVGNSEERRRTTGEVFSGH